MILRLATLDDLPKLGELVSLASAELEEKHGTPRMDAGLMNCLRIGIESRQAVVVAEQGGEVLGWCARVMLPGLAPGHAEGLGSWVREDYRRQHVARDLRRFADEHARQMGATFVTGTAAKDNIAGVMSCRNEGYVIVGYLMRKELRNEEAAPC